VSQILKADSFLDIGAYGKQSDGGTFSTSTLYHFLENYESTLPKPASFEGSGKNLPNEAFREKGFVM
jgi:hypothetical protein